MFVGRYMALVSTPGAPASFLASHVSKQCIGRSVPTTPLI